MVYQKIFIGVFIIFTSVYYTYSAPQTKYTIQPTYVQQQGQDSPKNHRVILIPQSNGEYVRAIAPGNGFKRLRLVPVSGTEQGVYTAVPNTRIQSQSHRFQPQHARPIQVSTKAKEIVEAAEEDEYPPDPNPQYNFSFDVKDDELTNYQNRHEERDGGVTKGSYSVVDPDGYIRTVTYTADSKNGFQAKVVREPTDVKVKIPVPTPSPDEQKKPLVQQYPFYSNNQNQPTYVLRRVPIQN